MPGSAGMKTPGVQHTQSFKIIACFRRALHMKGMLEVLADKGFWVWLSFRSVLGNSCCYIKRDLVLGGGRCISNSRCCFP